MVGDSNRPINGLDISDENFERALDVLVLVRGIDDNDTAQWALASISKDRYVAFKTAERRGKYDLAAFGNILERGPGLYPDSETWERIEDRYGVLLQYEEKLASSLKAVFEN